MQLKEFKDLTIRGSAGKCKQFIERVSVATSGDWRRATDLEQRLPKGEELFTFVCEANPARPGAAIVLTFRDEQEIYACNIVPSESTELDYDEYNAILDEFVARFARPVAEECGLEVTVSSGELRLQELLSSETFAALKGFSNAANRSTGSSHPLDARRWHQFLALAHKRDSALSSDVLGRWLSSEGWGEEQVYSLQVQYERARLLLQFYDENRESL